MTGVLAHGGTVGLILELVLIGIPVVILIWLAFAAGKQKPAGGDEEASSEASERGPAGG